jgi:hypothetical protein
MCFASDASEIAQAIALLGSWLTEQAN